MGKTSNKQKQNMNNRASRYKPISDKEESENEIDKPEKAKSAYEKFKSPISKSKKTIIKNNKALTEKLLPTTSSRATSSNEEMILSTSNSEANFISGAVVNNVDIEFHEITTQTMNSLHTASLTEENKIFIKEFINKGKQKIFPKKEFLINDAKKSYTSYLNFTKSITIIPEKTLFIKFQCLFCDLPPFKAKLGATSNIKAHLQRFHNDLLGNWFEVYDSRRTTNTFLIDDNTLKLVKYFISSNTAYKELENPFLNYHVKKHFQRLLLKKFWRCCMLQLMKN